jgi:hypothetical protein
VTKYVQAAADVLAGPVQQRQPLPGTVPLGDVDDGVVHAHRTAPVVVQPGERHDVRRLPVRRGLHLAHVLVSDHRLTGLQHVPHLRLYAVGVQARLDVRETQPEPVHGRSAAVLLQGRVGPHEAQVRVDDGDADRRPVGDLLQHRAAHVPAGRPGQLREQHQPPRAAVGLLRAGDPHHEPVLLSAAAPDRQQTRPAAVPAAPLDDPRHPLRVLGGQQVGHARPDHLGGRVAQQPPGLVGPAGHHAPRVEQQGRGIGHVEPWPGKVVLLICAHGRPLCR